MEEALIPQTAKYTLKYYVSVDDSKDNTLVPHNQSVTSFTSQCFANKIFTVDCNKETSSIIFKEQNKNSLCNLKSDIIDVQKLTNSFCVQKSSTFDKE